MTLTPTQLNLALSKLLPEKLHFQHFNGSLWWTESKERVKELELLGICWLVEETLTQNECNRYSQILRDTQLVYNPTALGWFFHATPEQRTIALCKVKGVGIV